MLSARTVQCARLPPEGGLNIIKSLAGAFSLQQIRSQRNKSNDLRRKQTETQKGNHLWECCLGFPVSHWCEAKTWVPAWEEGVLI